ncbi:hypothetical protein ACLB2K_040032 [Fragaria x ananassa]
MKKRSRNGMREISLPLEILDEILSWLPVKTLCRFKCVSKPLRDLISDPGFIKRHRDRAIQNEYVFYQRQRVIYTDHRLVGETKKFRPLSLYSLDLNASRLAPTKLNHVFGERYLEYAASFFWMFHCNGLLLCYFGGSGLCLLNPATRESKHVNRPRYLQDFAQINFLFGFGFADDDYKVVNGEIHVTMTDPLDLVTVFHAILLNGGLHWLMYRLGGESLMIVSLLLAEEEVREIQLPVGHGIRDGRMVLGVFRENKLFISDRRCRRNEIWVMMEYGVRESWTKISVFIPHWTLSRFCFWNSSQDLYVDGKSLAMYNYNNEGPFPPQSISGTGRVASVCMYFESLVSLNSVSTPTIKVASQNVTGLDINHSVPTPNRDGGGGGRDGEDSDSETYYCIDSDSESSSSSYINYVYSDSDSDSV